jgi:NADH-quinone oxidoreductase subunit H
MLIEIFQLLVFPGLFLAALIGLLYEGILRKLSAHMHNRVGPPIWQPVLDFLKLMLKEGIKPDRATILFTLVPILAFSSIITVVFLIPIAGLQLMAFPGNLIVAIYLLILSSLLYALAGWASSSPFGSVGSIREITQLFAYEFPLIVSLLTIGVLTSFTITPFLAWQFPFTIFAFLCSIQGKLSLPPFHIPEAEQEIVAGPLTEYSGPRLGLFYLARAIRLFVLVSLGSVFLFGGGDLLLFFIKSLGLLLVIAFIRTVFARIRIDQALRLYWFIIGPLAIIDFVRVLAGIF